MASKIDSMIDVLPTVSGLRPANSGQPAAEEQLTPREALRHLQEQGRLTPAQAERYLNEVREERLAVVPNI